MKFVKTRVNNYRDEPVYNEKKKLIFAIYRGLASFLGILK